MVTVLQVVPLQHNLVPLIIILMVILLILVLLLDLMDLVEQIINLLIGDKVVRVVKQEIQVPVLD